MTTIFDGKAFALEREKDLSIKVLDLFTEYDVVPKLASIIVGDDPASLMYQNMKKKAAERIGAVVEIITLPENSSKAAIIKNIEGFNINPKVTGIMIQLPLPERFTKVDRDEIITAIEPGKDVDGLRYDSKFTPPTAKAVLQILVEALLNIRPQTKNSDLYLRTTVVGATGFIGSQIVRALKKEYGEKVEIIEANTKTSNLADVISNSDVVVGVTGREDLIKADMIKPGAILIDVGAPKGDIEKSAYEKASFVSPVPGGVGPMTISCLMENLVLPA